MTDNTTPALKRRWLRFSLRTVFVVVTVLAVFLGWLVFQLNWIEQRRQAVADGTVDMRIIHTFEHTPRRVPWTLRLFGEHEIDADALLLPPTATEADVARVRGLFPEAYVDRQAGD